MSNRDQDVAGGQELERYRGGELGELFWGWMRSKCQARIEDNKLTGGVIGIEVLAQLRARRNGRTDPSLASEIADEVLRGEGD